jgi:hypothetical protein
LNCFNVLIDDEDSSYLTTCLVELQSEYQVLKCLFPFSVGNFTINQ